MNNAVLNQKNRTIFNLLLIVFLCAVLCSISVKSVRAEESSGLTGSEYVALFGVDSRSNTYEKGTRSDSLMIAKIDHDQKKVSIVSIYRDCMLHMDGHGYQKITHAYAYGGPEYAMEALNQNLDLNISRYVTLNFFSFPELVDAIGGVEMEITDEEAKVISDVDAAGTYVLNGKQALQYSRLRKAAGGDYKRAERQRDILFKIFETAKKLPKEKTMGIAIKFLKDVKTNFTLAEVQKLAADMSLYTIEKSVGYPQIFYGGTVEGAWVEVPCTLVDMVTEIHTYFGDTSYTPSETVRSFSSDLSAKVSGPNNNLQGLYGN